MPEGLTTLDGSKIDVDEVDREFARAMASEPKDATDLPKKPAETTDKTSDSKKKPRSRPPKSARTRTTPTPQTDAERKEGIASLVQLGSGITLMLSNAAPHEPAKQAFMADAVTLANSAEGISDAVVATAKADPKFARAVDKITAVGPYGALLSVTLGVGMQIVRNHKPDAALPGTVHPKEVVDSLAQEDPAHGPAA